MERQLSMHPPISDRFRGFLPVVIDVETGGFNAATDALLEMAAVTLAMDEDGILMPSEIIYHAVIPFEGANVEQAALNFTGIDINDPYRMALEENEALRALFQPIRNAVKDAHCSRAVMVAHNAHFDLGFVNAAVERNGIKRNPFHPFSCFDTATLAGLAYGQTVLARACEAAEIEFSNDKAHSAAYDAEKTAELFCGIVNRWKDLGGWHK
ncbi:MAG: ribonuclease T [Porticoccus sp.]|jgi:ribonuclease T|uniref:ribonuclease T n=1 Tax=Porticoccus hydrocarbonoclasticus TaxID=1073414 RepID=UPI0005667D36|nr:ribonuclease T [Porticoccus hydrocarbonoclasticus]MBG58157.1 ribonuclease T [Porticoccus sp.]|tara:strand:+ start:8320 stop:8952 length:633 start_codon:yes stop_codon:yes gene_type:complete